MTDFPDLKLKSLVSFPAAVYGGTGIAVRKENGQFYFDLDYGEFALIASIPDAAEPTTYVALWDQTQHTYRIINVTNFKTELGGFPEAPNDGVQYGRQSLGWTPINAAFLPLTGGTLTGNLTITKVGSNITLNKTANPDSASVVGQKSGVNRWLLELGNGITESGGNSGSNFSIARYTDAGGLIDASLTISRATGVTSFVAPPNAPSPAAGSNDGQLATTAFVTAATVLRGYLSGLGLSTAGASATFGIAVGVACDSANTAMMALGAAYTKTTAAWALGTGVGALDTGAIANNTWYHAFLIKRPDTGVVDVLVSLSATAPTLPASYTLFRRIGSMKTNASAQWVKFIQDGDTFTWDAIVLDVSATNPGTSAVTRTLSTPSGVRNEAVLTAWAQGDNATDLPGAILVTDLSISDAAPLSGTVLTFAVYLAGVAATNMQLGAPMRVFTNTSSQIRTRLQLSAAGTHFNIYTSGWVDRRGRDA